ncbi:C40 family peptidase [Puniceibacterium confluentis]|uniref:C40 family peptidase n=1 Tax=Puniceibacterium confluentis TaxID=1958944 RepID=UPI0011B66445|nr:NlpC/P60 family protein [Puniceibacterium confluentis]
MNDRRLTPANTRVAAEHLRGSIEAAHFSAGEPRRVVVPVVDLLRAPAGARDRQILFGAAVTVYDEHEGWAFVQAAADGYVGYVPVRSLGVAPVPTHRVDARATHVYSLPDFKSTNVMTLSYGAQLDVVTDAPDPVERFVATRVGYVPRAHLVPLGTTASDPVAEAEKLLGTPYLWGGNSAFGIDCSGLVQATLAACGQACPGDSDLQETSVGRTLPKGTAPRRGDLLFWKGHVGWVAAPDMLLHANVHAMAVALEPLAAALTRIETQGDGPVIRHARLIEDALK